MVRFQTTLQGQEARSGNGLVSSRRGGRWFSNQSKASLGGCTAGCRGFGLGGSASNEGLPEVAVAVPEPALPTVLAVLLREVLTRVKVKTRLWAPWSNEARK